MIEARPSRCTPEQWTAEQAARAMGVVDEADGEALGVEGAEVGEIGVVRAVGREEPNARGRMRWVAGGAAVGVVAAAAWWSGAGIEDSWEIPVHAGPDGALIAGERTPNSGPGDFNSSNGSSHMKIQTTAAAALLGAAAGAFQSQAGDAVQWRVADGGNGHWYEMFVPVQGLTWNAAASIATARGGHLATLTSIAENDHAYQLAHATAHAWVNLENGTLTGPWLGGVQDHSSADYREPAGGWTWVTHEPWGFTRWSVGDPSDSGNQDVIAMSGSCCSTDGPDWNDLNEGTILASAMIEWSADCNSDGIVDYGQILAGTLDDANANGVPDRCECATNPGLPSCCLGDIVNDRTVNGADLGTLLAYWGPVTSGAFSIASDLNNDGDIDGSDLGILLAYWGACPTANVPTWATLIEAMPDPAVVTNPALRTAIAATGLAWRVRDTGTGIEMLLVPPGIFQMGCIMGSNMYECYSWEQPVHQVTLTNAFYIARYEMTQAQWVAKMGSNPSQFQGAADSANRPVEKVSWTAIQSYLSTTNMRLPTEAEWEFACRAGTQSPFYNGSSNDSTVGALAWYNGNSSSQTHAVGGKAPNALGLYDMLGNVWEWVNDWYGSYSASMETDPAGPTSGTLRCFRGGAWFDPDTRYLRSSYRGGFSPQFFDTNVGFRVARNP